MELETKIKTEDCVFSIIEIKQEEISPEVEKCIKFGSEIEIKEERVEESLEYVKEFVNGMEVN
jgi:hypothetical protein